MRSNFADTVIMTYHLCASNKHTYGVLWLFTVSPVVAACMIIYCIANALASYLPFAQSYKSFSSHLFCRPHARPCSVIVDKIDDNKDGFVDLYELKTWIAYTQKRYIEEDVNRQWKQHNPDNTDKLSWEVSGTI